jgi:hypothetical protein
MLVTYDNKITYGVSPAFLRQDIKDEIHDFQLVPFFYEVTN